MPEVDHISTHGAFNGLSSCVPKINVLDRGDGNPYDYWTTASGFNKDSIGSPTSTQINQSLQNICKVYWNLYKIDLDAYVGSGDPPVTELIIDGKADQSGAAIQPEERACSGSQTTLNDPFTDEVAIFADLRLGEDQGFARLYSGDTNDEDNFLGYSLGEAAFSYSSAIQIYVYEGFYDATLSIGGYAVDETFGFRSWNYTYIEIDGIHTVFVGAGGGGGVTTNFTQEPPTVLVTSGSSVIAKAQVTAFEFYTYAMIENMDLDFSKPNSSSYITLL